MGHIPHLLHWLFEETKAGGPLVLVGAVIGYLVVGQPLMVESELCKLTTTCHDKVFEFEHLAANLFGAVAGGLVFLGIAMVLVDIGVSKEKLGIEE